MFRRSIVVVLLSFGASQAASALDQRCGGPLDFLLCVDPSLSYSETLPPRPAASEQAGTQTNAANVGTDKPDLRRTPIPVARPLRPPLSLDYRVINHASKSGTNTRAISEAAKNPDTREQAMSRSQKEELYRAFLVWQRKQVINEMRDQSTLTRDLSTLR